MRDLEKGTHDNANTDHSICVRELPSDVILGSVEQRQREGSDEDTDIQVGDPSLKHTTVRLLYH